MSKKQIELPPCACGGEAKRTKAFGKHRVVCAKCGKKTATHSQPSEATKEWKKIAAATVKQDAKAEAEKKPAAAEKSAKAAKSLKEVEPKADAKAIEAIAKLAALAVVAKKLSEGLDDIGKILSVGMTEKDARVAADKAVGEYHGILGVKPEARVEVKANVISGEEARNLMKALAAAGAVPKEVADGFCKKAQTKKGGK